MRTIWIKRSIFYLAVAITLIAVVIPLIMNENITYIIIVAPALAIFIGGISLGIMNEMKKIFGVGWKRPFFLLIGFIYLVSSGLIPISLFVSTEKVNFWRYTLFFMLIALPVLYLILFLSRQFIDGKKKGGVGDV